jgi:hypothetical protein
MTKPFLITTPGRRVTTGNLVLRVPLKLGSKVVPTNLMALSLDGIDVILGMDWLTQHQLILDIATRMIEINSPIVGTSTLYLPYNGCRNSYAFTAITSLLGDIPIVFEYLYVFSDVLPGMPPDRDIEFMIELQPDTTPISKRPYRMPPKELAELKNQLKNFLIMGTFAKVLLPGDVLLFF